MTVHECVGCYKDWGGYMCEEEEGKKWGMMYM